VPRRATVAPNGAVISINWHEPQRRVAPGQTVVMYDPSDTRVLGGGIVTR
jgi:tRNA-uridine 2-sulfurtransferase